MLDNPAKKVRSVKPVGDLPAELWENLEESHHQVREAQVLDEQVHARALLLGVVHGQQNAQITDDATRKVTLRTVISILATSSFLPNGSVVLFAVIWFDVLPMVGFGNEL